MRQNDERNKPDKAQKVAEHASGPRYPFEVGTRDTDQQAHEQRKRSHTTERFVSEKVSYKPKRHS